MKEVVQNVKVDSAQEANIIDQLREYLIGWPFNWLTYESPTSFAKSLYSANILNSPRRMIAITGVRSGPVSVTLRDFQHLPENIAVGDIFLFLPPVLTIPASIDTAFQHIYEMFMHLRE